MKQDNILEIGKLFSTDCCLLVYSNIDFNSYDTKSIIKMEDVGRNFGDAYHEPLDAHRAATFFAKRLGQKVWHTEPHIWFMILDSKITNSKRSTQDMLCYKILHDTKIGWFVWNEWLKIKSLKEGK